MRLVLLPYLKNTDSNKTSRFRAVSKVRYFLKAVLAVEQLINK